MSPGATRGGGQGSQTGQSQLGRSLTLDCGSGCEVSCAAYFLCDLSTPLSHPGPQSPHLSDRGGSGTLQDHVNPEFTPGGELPVTPPA